MKHEQQSQETHLESKSVGRCLYNWEVYSSTASQETSAGVKTLKA